LEARQQAEHEAALESERETQLLAAQRPSDEATAPTGGKKHEKKHRKKHDKKHGKKHAGKNDKNGK